MSAYRAFHVGAFQSVFLSIIASEFRWANGPLMSHLKYSFYLQDPHLLSFEETTAENNTTGGIRQNIYS